MVRHMGDGMKTEDFKAFKSIWEAAGYQYPYLGFFESEELFETGSCAVNINGEIYVLTLKIKKTGEMK